MHYIRLLRPPAVELHRGQLSLKIVLTITTDLSDDFLTPNEPIELAIIGASHVVGKDGAQGPPTPVILTPARKPRWQAGIRALKFDVQLPPQPVVIQTIQIRPANRNITALTTSDIYPGPTEHGLVLPVYADIKSVDEDKLHICFRSLRLPQPDGSSTVNALQVEEEMGESMARHIWDGGLTTVSLIADLCLSPATEKKPLPGLRDILRQRVSLNIIELGCGVGILGVGIARALSLSTCVEKRSTHVLMTDLPDAEVRARANITRCLDQSASADDKDTSLEIDFDSLDWNEGKIGVFSHKVLARPWDLVVLSDCTYNDLLPALVQTLSAFHRISAERGIDTRVMVSTKPRHDNERAYFDLMDADGWRISEETVLPLPVLNSDAQTVEVYLFSKN
ncbi:putative methyltransferase-domain-containing protein [Apodospora peruviana]|uniref:Methyltransferase-domain-containing protein n=1 Tax=Apodospora peruviana TaxID=516989 RepID=A0AAE0I1N9_9PEZI|nr:putative methyltransferase-domain-containing protein [Apodospora peruviana]